MSVQRNMWLQLALGIVTVAAFVAIGAHHDTIAFTSLAVGAYLGGYASAWLHSGVGVRMPRRVSGER